jgi:Fe-S-cluster containining protein
MPAADPFRSRRFACTACGACCDRSPEVELCEAAALSDVFVFRLMFRLYELPRSAGDWLAARAGAGSAEVFYESKRLLAAFAARKYPVKQKTAGKTVEYTRYLTVSALTLDRGSGRCAALDRPLCGIYGRRPLSCRSVPFHYSRPKASAETYLDGFVARPGYACDTSAAAPLVLDGGRVVDHATRQVREEALERAERDRPWREAIMRQMKVDARNRSLPSLRDIDAAAAFGATTVSMRVAWQIAASAGLLTMEELRTLIAAQAETIERELAAPDCAPATRETLTEMRTEYAQLLS